MNNEPSPRQAFAEDLRRVGVATLVGAVIGGFLPGHVSGGATIVAGVAGLVLNMTGYWLHRIGGPT